MENIGMKKSLVLGFQHLFAMFGATVLVPILTGLSSSVALLAAGIGTLLFHWVTKRKVPVFLGSSFAFISVIIIAKDLYGMNGVQWGIMSAGVVYMILSALIKSVGVEKIKALFPPIVIGPIIMLIGLNLSGVAIQMASGAFIAGNKPVLSWVIALFTLFVVIMVSILEKGFFKLVPILIGFAAGYILVVILKVTGAYPEIMSFQPIADANWISLGEITFPKLNDWASAIGGISIIAPVALVTFMEHIGDVTTISATVNKDFIKEPGLHRTILGDGIATITAGLIGGPANTTYGENIGVLAITKVYDPKVLRIAAVYAIILGCIGKFGGFLATIPDPVKGGISILLFGMIAAVGLRMVADSELDFAHSRNLIIAALIFVLGLGISATGGIQLTDNINISGLFVAVVVGVIANLILPKEI